MKQPEVQEQKKRHISRGSENKSQPIWLHSVRLGTPKLSLANLLLLPLLASLLLLLLLLLPLLLPRLPAAPHLTAAAVLAGPSVLCLSWVKLPECWALKLDTGLGNW